MRTPDLALFAAILLCSLPPKAFGYDSLGGPLQIGPGLPSVETPRNCQKVVETRPTDMSPDAISGKAWDLLFDEEGITRENFRERVFAKFRASGTVLDIQRVEMTGVFTGEDGGGISSLAFDSHLHPSRLAEVDREYARDVEGLPWYKKGIVRRLQHRQMQKDAIESDLSEAREEMMGILTSSGAVTLAPLKGRSIREIVAHSWGSDIIYNGILSGDISPLPKKVTVIGVPSGYVTKWTELAKRLDIEVRVVSSPDDAVRKANTELWGVRVAAGMDSPPIYSREAWAEKVDAYCRGIGTGKCKQEGGPISLREDMAVQLTDAGPLGHEREAYYLDLSKRGALSPSPAELRAEQDILIDSEMRDVFAEASRRARTILESSPITSVTREVCGAWKPEERPQAARPYTPSESAAAVPAIPALRDADICTPDLLASRLEEIAVRACYDPAAPPTATVDAVRNCNPSGLLNDRYRPTNADSCVQQLFVTLRDQKQGGQSELLTSAWVTARANEILSALRQSQEYIDPPARKGKTCRRGVWTQDDYPCD